MLLSTFVFIKVNMNLKIELVYFLNTRYWTHFAVIISKNISLSCFNRFIRPNVKFFPTLFYLLFE